MAAATICWERERRWRRWHSRNTWKANHVAGTLRYYGTPAEEGGDGKVYLVRAGLFQDVDVVLHWHPADHNAVTNGGALAITSAKFLFHGIAAHAALAPERGTVGARRGDADGHGHRVHARAYAEQRAHPLCRQQWRCRPPTLFPIPRSCS